MFLSTADYVDDAGLYAYSVLAHIVRLIKESAKCVKEKEPVLEPIRSLTRRQPTGTFGVVGIDAWVVFSHQFMFFILSFSLLF